MNVHGVRNPFAMLQHCSRTWAEPSELEAQLHERDYILAHTASASASARSLAVASYCELPVERIAESLFDNRHRGPCAICVLVT